MPDWKPAGWAFGVEFGNGVSEATKPFFLRRPLLWGVLSVVALFMLLLWLGRAPIADHFVQEQLASRGVSASYTIEKVGLSTQRVSNIVIGDPAHPDLTANQVEIHLGFGSSGPTVSLVRADAVRIYGRVIDGQLSLGTLDKFRDPTSTDPLILPDLAVDLTDARALIATPWGDIGAALNGRGNLRKDFSGTLAMVAPKVVVAGCTAKGLSFYGKLAIESVQPTLRGPLRGRSLVCDQSDLEVTSPQVALDLALSEDFRNWHGTYDASIAALHVAAYRADRLGVTGAFKGNIERTEVDSAVQLAVLHGPAFSAYRVNIDAKATVGKAYPAVKGTLRFASAGASRALRRSLLSMVFGVKGSPIGPLADKAATALSLALADVSGRADFVLTGDQRTRRIELVAPQLNAASGAKITASSDSRLAYLLGTPDPALLIAGQWTLSGGGLPEGAIRIDRQADGTTSGTARFEPYRAGSAQLALTPVRFSGGRNGRLRFNSIATLSGPVAGGRITELAIPLNGQVNPTGALTLRGGCSVVRLESTTVGSLKVGRNEARLCSKAGQPLLALGDKGLQGTVVVPYLSLSASSSGSPVRITAKRGEIDLATQRWSVALANVSMGMGDSTTEFTMKSLTGQAAKSGLAGRLDGAQGHIGSVPLELSEMGGDWTWSNGRLSLDGSVVLSDRQADPRFFPMISQNAHLSFVSGVIDATAGFSERKSGVKILDTVIQHKLNGDGGHADLIVDNLRFNSDFQPDQLSALALGVVANAEGSVVGNGRIDWNSAGVTSHGTFATAGANLAAAFGPVRGLTTTLTFDDLLNLHTPAQQIASIEEVNTGIPVLGGKIDYQLLGPTRIRVDGGEWPFAGGKLSLHPTTLDFGAERTRYLTFDLNGVDAAVFLQQFGFDNISASGVFDGTLPVEFDGLGGRIVNGRLDSRSGGGTLAYVGELSNRDLGAIANFAFSALKSLKYDDLTIVLNGDLDGEMVTDIRFGGVGQGKGASRNFLTKQIAALPLIFNVKISAPFRQLITSAKGFYDPSLLVQQNLRALAEEQEAQRRAKEKPSVQPSESEPMP